MCCCIICYLQNYNAKLSDFGLARDGPTGDKSHVSTRVMGTYGYAAPEYLATGIVPSSVFFCKYIVHANLFGFYFPLSTTVLYMLSNSIGFVYYLFSFAFFFSFFLLFFFLNEYLQFTQHVFQKNVLLFACFHNAWRRVSQSFWLSYGVVLFTFCLGITWTFYLELNYDSTGNKTK